MIFELIAGAAIADELSECGEARSGGPRHVPLFDRTAEEFIGMDWYCMTVQQRDFFRRKFGDELCCEQAWHSWFGRAKGWPRWLAKMLYWPDVKNDLRAEFGSKLANRVIACWTEAAA